MKSAIHMIPSDPLYLLRQQYFSLVPARLLLLPSSISLANQSGQTYLIQHLLDEKTIPQPEDTYRRHFWRVVLRELEDGLLELQGAARESGEEEGGWNDGEVDERFYETLAGLMVDLNPESLSEPKQSHRTFIYRLPGSTEEERHITLLEEQTVLQGGTTGLRTWTAALHLGHHLLYNPTAFIPPTSAGTAAPRVLELGAGTGFLSCLLAQQGCTVIATDIGDVLGGGLSPLARLRHNVSLNTLSSVDVEDLNWFDSIKQPDQRPDIWVRLEEDPPDVIVAADVIYDPDLIPPIVATLFILLNGSSEDRPRHAIIAATVRNETTLNLFMETCSQRELDVDLLDLPPADTSNPTFWDSGLDVFVPVRIMRITLRMQDR